MLLQVEDQAESLKYLEFVWSAAVHAIVLFLNIYDFAKENSGPLKPGVQTVEGAVKTIIGPVYEKFQDIPLDLLKFADRKVSNCPLYMGYLLGWVICLERWNFGLKKFLYMNGDQQGIFSFIS